MQASAPGTAVLAAGVVEQTLYYFLGIAVAVLFEAQGPGVIGIGQVAQFQQHLGPGWIVPQHAKGLAARARTGTQGGEQNLGKITGGKILVASVLAFVV